MGVNAPNDIVLDAMSTFAIRRSVQLIVVAYVYSCLYDTHIHNPALLLTYCTVRQYAVVRIV